MAMNCVTTAWNRGSYDDAMLVRQGTGLQTDARDAIGARGTVGNASLGGLISNCVRKFARILSVGDAERARATSRAKTYRGCLIHVLVRFRGYFGRENSQECQTDRFRFSVGRPTVWMSRAGIYHIRASPHLKIPVRFSEESPRAAPR